MKKSLAILLALSLLLLQACSINTASDKLNFVYIMDPTGTKNTDNAGVIAAFDEIKSYYDFNYATYTPDSNKAVANQVLSSYGTGCNLIIGSSYAVNSNLLEYKADYPAVNIALIGTSDETNMSMSIDFKMEDSAFLAGVLAASSSKTGVIGYIGGYAADLVNYEVGYYAGAKTANPNIVIISDYTDSYNNVSKGYDLAISQINRGADVIFSNCAASSLGVSKAVGERQILIIFSELYTKADNDYSLGTTTKNYKKAALYVIDSFINDNFILGTNRFGIAYDMVDFEPSDIVSDNLKDVLNEYRSQIRQYSIDIPNTWDKFNNFNYSSYIN